MSASFIGLNCARIDRLLQYRIAGRFTEYDITSLQCGTFELIHLLKEDYNLSHVQAHHEALEDRVVHPRLMERRQGHFLDGA